MTDMINVTVNGVDKKFPKGSTLRDVVAGEPYTRGTLVSLQKSSEKLRTESDDFEVHTNKGTITIHMDDSKDAAIWKKLVGRVEGTSARWVTHDIAAFGSFATNIKVDRTESMRRKYDVFFSLGGFDSGTTYVMIAREDRRGAYGAGPGRIGRVTRGRHVVDTFTEGDHIISINPAVSETLKENFTVTSNLRARVGDGNKVDTCIKVNLDMDNPESAEHLMIVAQKGFVNATEVSGSYMGVYDDLDVKIPREKQGVRDEGSVFVRNTGVGTGKIFFYRERRQTSENHNHIGDVVLGRAIMESVKQDDKVTVVTEPKRIITVGMTVKEGERVLKDAGIEVTRVGDTSDDAIIVEQDPEMTVTLLNQGKVNITGVPKDRVFRISLNRKKPEDVHYFEKITGLNHKPIGVLKVHFWFEGMSMITFQGDEVRGKSLYPGEPFKRCRRGDIGFTNQACDQHGLLGIRMQNSTQYGPTGEEPFGTNIFGRFLGDLDHMVDGLEDDMPVYVTEMEL